MIYYDSTNDLTWPYPILWGMSAHTQNINMVDVVLSIQMKKTRSQTRHRLVANSLLPGAAIWCELQGILASETCNSFKFREASLETGGLVLVCSFWLWISIENPNESKSTPGSFPAALLDDQKHPEAAVSKAVAKNYNPNRRAFILIITKVSNTWIVSEQLSSSEPIADVVHLSPQAHGSLQHSTCPVVRNVEEMNLHHGVRLTPHDMVYTSSQKVDLADTSWWLIQ